jgi:hypothetical protein
MEVEVAIAQKPREAPLESRQIEATEGAPAEIGLNPGIGKGKSIKNGIAIATHCPGA